MLVPMIRDAIRFVDPTVASQHPTMKQVIATNTARRRFQTSLLTIFGAIALLLALVGLYGLLAYSVRQRVAEIGVRIALGASRPRVIGMVVRQAPRLVVAGLSIGLVAAFACVHLLANMLYRVRAYDPWTFIAAPLLVATAALVACCAPAWRAAHIDAMQAFAWSSRVRTCH
jgi:ABC-type antimicrobial peptide transport system permease subunit